MPFSGSPLKFILNRESKNISEEKRLVYQRWKKYFWKILRAQCKPPENEGF
jgi:hypothetical protein